MANSVSEAKITRPSTFMLLLEPFRASIELASLAPLASLPLSAPRGDGHSVLVIPGFAATDSWTYLLRRYLTFQGYQCEAWNLGRNLGYGTLGNEAEHLHARIRQVYEQSGRKISIVGWSMGGVMARYAACVQPDLVRQVISVGAPFTGDPTAISILEIYQRLSGESVHHPLSWARFERDRRQPPVPTTSIYSKTDGVAAWQNCIEPEGPLAENVEVCGSHTGLVVNPIVLRRIAERLAEPEGALRGRVDREDRKAA